MAKNIGTLGNILGKSDQRRLWKLICIVNHFDLLFNFLSQKSNLSLDNNNLKCGEISLWNECFFSNTRWTQLLTPLEILMSKISLKYIPIHIHNFEHYRVIMNIILSSHGFLFHRNINRRENKAQIPLIIHHNEKKQRIYCWCAAKDNWASHISEVALRKEPEQWNFPFPPSGHHQGNN